MDMPKDHAPKSLEQMDPNLKVDPEYAQAQYEQMQEVKNNDAKHKMVFTTRLYYNRQRKDSITSVSIKN
jgi:hypothetical protein